MTFARPFIYRLLWIALPIVLTGAATYGAIDTKSAASAADGGHPSDVTPEQLAERVAALIRQLGDKNYLVRQSAQNELSHIGPEAFDALTAAESDTDVEVSSRAKYLVQQIRAQWIHDSDSPQIKKILDKYELADEATRMEALRQLVLLPHDSGLATLCRLMRFERSPLVSKFSALLVIGQPSAAARPWPERQKTIETNLAKNNGSGAQWLRAYIRFRNDPQGAAAQIDKLVDSELVNLIPPTGEAQRQNLMTLVSQMASILEFDFQRRDQALELLQKLSPIVINDQSSLASFADLLVQHQAWSLIEDLAQRAGGFNTDPTLLYTLAHALRAEGKADQAEKTASRAFELVGNNLDNHELMGKQLKRLGLFDAAEREYRHVINKAPQDTDLTIEAQAFLAEMLHDQERELEAAQVLQKQVDAMEKDATVLKRIKDFGGEDYPDKERGQMHYYYACHQAAQGNLSEQKRELDQGAKYDPTNADILIALYDISANDPERRKQAIELIHAADKLFREGIGLQPTDPLQYNQDAWLIGNTEGDFDLAIQYSKNSIELLKNQSDDYQSQKPGFLDTLAHCYAGKGDWENAVKYQAQAAELDPHTLQISRAVEKFKAQLEKKHTEKSASP
jgi:tetratricopeptide (TPR) repeat protein